MTHVICDISAAMRKSTVALKGQMCNLRKHQQKFCKSTQNKIEKPLQKNLNKTHKTERVLGGQ